MNKQIGRIALTLWLLLMLVPAMALAAGTKYVVVGAQELCGSDWDVSDEANRMQLQPDGTYVKVFSNVSPYDGIEIKVVEIREDFTQIWHGVGGENFIFNVTKACDVTVTFDPKTTEIKVSGSGVVVPTGLDVAYITAVGNGGYNWLYDKSWNPSASENRMTEVSPGVYEITYSNVGQSNNYQVKFAANGSWTDTWGGAFAGSGVETTAVYGGDGDGIEFSAPYASNDIALRLDLSGYDHSTRKGATFTVTIAEHHTHSFSEAWDKDATHHWHQCQVAGCPMTRVKVRHTMNPATCVRKATCAECGYETGEFNHKLTRIPAKPATAAEDGNIEYWRCEDCKRCFSDPNGTHEIRQEDTVIPRLPAGGGQGGVPEDMPKTGDASRPGLWLVLLLASTLALCAVLAQRKKRGVH